MWCLGKDSFISWASETILPFTPSFQWNLHIIQSILAQQHVSVQSVFVSSSSKILSFSNMYNTSARWVQFLTFVHIMVGLFEILPQSRKRSSAQHAGYKLLIQQKPLSLSLRDFSVCGPELGALYLSSQTNSFVRFQYNQVPIWSKKISMKQPNQPGQDRTPSRRYREKAHISE